MPKNGDDAPMNGGENREPQMATLATAYALAHYFVTIGHREWLFGVGQLALDIERELGAGQYLFITAWNPPSRPTTVAGNLAADERLQARLKESGFQHHSALGCNAQGGVRLPLVTQHCGQVAHHAIGRQARGDVPHPAGGA